MSRNSPAEGGIGVFKGAAVASVTAVERRSEALHPYPEVPEEHVESISIHRCLETASLFY